MCAAIINKASKAPEGGGEFETSSKKHMYINTAPIIHEETISLSSRSLGCCLGAVQKPCPGTQPCPSRATGTGSPPGEVPAPRFPTQQLSWHRQPRHSALAGSSPAYLLPVWLPDPPAGAREQAERMAALQPQPRDGLLRWPAGRSARRGAGRSPCGPRRPVRGVGEPGEPRR